MSNGNDERYQAVTDCFAQAITVKKWEYASYLKEIEGLREEYLERYSVWWESTRRPNGGAGGYVPDDIREFGKQVEAKQRKIIDFRLAIENLRHRFRMWISFRDLGEAEECPECGYHAFVPFPEEYRDIMLCWVCEHKQTVRDVAKYTHLPHPDR